MGIITPDRFNPIKAYCNVRLQQGVPLVDADVNELDDVRKFEVRAFLKWFVGDGVPDGNDGFRISALPTPSATDFVIGVGITPNTTTTAAYVQPASGGSVTLNVASTAGMAPLQYLGVTQANATFAGFYRVTSVGGPTQVTVTLPTGAGIASGATVTTGATVLVSGATNLDTALHFAGRCIVDGLDVVITRDTLYSAQTLSAVDLAPPYSLPPVAPIPSGAAQVLVYLDVWERVVSPTEDPNLIVPPLGTESCARIKRFWVVRTRQGASLPRSTDADFVPGHLYYALAVVNRTAGAAIAPAALTDLRERGLSILPTSLIQDVFGESASAYRQQQGRPSVSLREAINSLARGEAPGLAEQSVNANPLLGQSEINSAAAIDSSNGLVVAWEGYGPMVGTRTPVQILLSRLDFGNPSAGFASAIGIPQGPTVNHDSPSVASLPGGDVIVAYRSVNQSGLPTSDIQFRRGATFAALATAAEQSVTSSALAPLVVAGNQIVVFFFIVTSAYQYRRYDAVTGAFVDANPVPIAGATNATLHAAVDSAGNVWVAFATPLAAGSQTTSVQVFRLNPTTGAIDATATFTSAANNSYYNPFVVCGAGQVWVFWEAGGVNAGTIAGGIWAVTYDGAAWGAADQVPYTLTRDTYPKAAFEADGRIALTFVRPLPPSNSPESIFLSLGEPSIGGWHPPIAAVTVGTSRGVFGGPSGSLLAHAGSLWLVWSRLESPTYATRLSYRQLCPQL